MKICIVGLGLIGGSVARALKKNGTHTVFGMDINDETIKEALAQEVIDNSIAPQELSICDVVILGLYPEATIKFVDENAKYFAKGSIVLDTCGIKSAICGHCEKKLGENGVKFVGCHPMAGRELWGFMASVDNLFDNASFIICKTENTDDSAIEVAKSLANEMGFLRSVISTPKEHDEVIAYTSQLAHIVSSAYVKSPSLLRQCGFSAGSFRDLTRVARLNENMWTSLFMLNREPLISEIDHVIDSLIEYRDVLRNGDDKKLYELLRDGRVLKEKSNEQNAKVARELEALKKSKENK